MRGATRTYGARPSQALIRKGGRRGGSPSSSRPAEPRRFAVPAPAAVARDWALGSLIRPARPAVSRPAGWRRRRAIAIAVELVLDRHRQGRARLHGPPQGGIDVRDVQPDAYAGTAELLRGLPVVLREGIGQHHHRPRQRDFCVGDPAIGHRHPHPLARPERPLIELDRPRRIIHGQERDWMFIALRDGPRRHRSDLQPSRWSVARHRRPKRIAEHACRAPSKRQPSDHTGSLLLRTIPESAAASVIGYCNR
jgi:hypothetical protein